MDRELAGIPQFDPYGGSGCQVIGFVDDDPAKPPATVKGLPALGGRLTMHCSGPRSWLGRLFDRSERNRTPVSKRDRGSSLHGVTQTAGDADPSWRADRLARQG